MKYAKMGATLFVLWGVLHVVGGLSILLAVAESPTDGYAIYENSSSAYTDLAGSVLGYLAYGFVWIGALVSWVGVRYNWHNSHAGLMLNTVLVGLTDIGLLLFLVEPGYVSWFEAMPGMLLFAGAAVSGGVACRAAGDPAMAT